MRVAMPVEAPVATAGGWDGRSALSSSRMDENRSATPHVVGKATVVVDHVRRVGRSYTRDNTLDFNQPLVWTVDDVMSPDECGTLIARIEALGCEPATITTAAGFVHRPEIRNNDRVIFDDHELAATLYARVAHTVPDTMFSSMAPVGANERFRCYRYAPGQRFAPHYDGSFARSHDEESTLTLMVYLNDAFEGGETTFLDHEVTIVPRRGLALLFQHRQHHEGCPVRAGVKYVLRSDVMYRARRRATKE